MKLRLSDDVRIELVDGQFVVLDRTGKLVHSVTDDSADLLRLVVRR